MNKTAIKNFAVWARNKLIADISYRAGLIGITESGIASALPQSTGTTEFYDIGTAEPYSISGDAVRQRRRLVELIERKEKETDYKTAYKYIIEEVAYTWFNRLIAIRFMEVNDYLPSHIRVLSSESGKMEPDLVTNPYDADLEFTNDEENLIYKMKQENKLDNLFRMLFIKQCNALSEILPGLFEKTADYTELLLAISFTDTEGIVYHLLTDIDEKEFDIEQEGQVEIIGWLYQYYNDERKNEVININKGVIEKEDLPAATQLFTTDWVVRYMIDNSLGRYWIERNPESELASKLEFLTIDKSELKQDSTRIEPTEIKIFDPCMGSGHILVYAFDVLMEIYRECGYSDREAAISILENNIYGLDIDERAYQLAYFAVMMKARSYNRRILNSGITPNVLAFCESNSMDNWLYDNISLESNYKIIGQYLIDTFKDAKEIGSLQEVKNNDYKAFKLYLHNFEINGQLDIYSSSWVNETLPQMLKLISQAEIMTQKYTVVCTNPPYFNKMDEVLKNFISKNYADYAGDLFATFIYRSFDYLCQDGYSAFMAPFVWMFIKKYENLRKYIIERKDIVSLIQMEYSAFEEATVPICSFVMKNERSHSKGIYFRLTDFKGGMDVQKDKVLEGIKNMSSSFVYRTDINVFTRTPGMLIIYWASDRIIQAFEREKTISYYGAPRVGLQTGENEKFVRLWQEVEWNNVELTAKSHEDSYNSGKKWFPYNKGGEYRKWYGNNDCVVDWYLDGKNIREDKLYKLSIGKCLPSNSKPKNEQYYFLPAITWSKISSGSIAFRYKPVGHIFDTAGTSIFTNDEMRYYLLGFCNSKVAMHIAGMISPTINYQSGDIAQFPVIVDKTKKKFVQEFVQENIMLSQQDWDSFENSWDFKRHPLLHGNLISEAYDMWERTCKIRFNKMKENEEYLNKIFIEMYGLQEELLPDVPDKEVTIRKADVLREIKSLLSYAVGCMFGRYSLNQDGIVFAGGDWCQEKYSGFVPDTDNIIPITDEEYLEDDIIVRLCEWLKYAYGELTLEQNLDYIANVLGNQGSTSRETIRNYFANEFFKNHCSDCSISGSGKRPIYWLFESGKQNGFKALIYMHRYNENTIGNLRVDYLHRIQRIYESEISRMQDMIDNSSNSREVAKSTKRKEKLQKQLKECREYDGKIGHLALSRIRIDLDDGVKINYDKVQIGSDNKKYSVLAKI